MDSAIYHALLETETVECDVVTGALRHLLTNSDAFREHYDSL